MVQFYNSLSPTTRLLIQSLLSALGSVLAGVATAVFQSYTQAGRLDIPTLWIVTLSTFALLFGKTMHDWVPAHAQQLIQAGKENEAKLYDALQRAQIIRGQSLPAVQPPQQPVIIQQPPAISVEHIQALSQQIALNLANMAGSKAGIVSPASTSMPVTPTAPALDPYVDPLRVSALLPAYTPPPAQAQSVSSYNPVPSGVVQTSDVSQQATQSYQAVPQVPFPAQVAP